MMYKTFQNPFGHYLYDARINRITCISEQLDELLSRDQEEQLNMLPEYIHLKEIGFFNDSNFVIEHENAAMVPYYYKRGLKSISLQVTQACNFRCEYCPYTDNVGIHRLHSAKNMTMDVANKALNFLHTHSIDSKSIHIGFYGGEPCLRYDLIKEVIEKSNELFEGKELTYNLTTNCSLLTRDMMAFFDENNVFLTVSLDGPKDINDTYRKFAGHATDKSVYDVAMEKLEIISDEFPNLSQRTTINMVMNPGYDFSLLFDITHNTEGLASLAEQLKVLTAKPVS